jgi:hypothetical protein
MGNIKMTQYTKVAIKVIENIKENPTLRPDEEWERIIKLDIKSVTSQNKPCPKGTFLGLCENGNVMGIQKGNYTDSINNKKYAIEGLRLYKINPQLSITNLWIDTLSSLNEVCKRPNGQMSIVVDLYNKGYIK